MIRRMATALLVAVCSFLAAAGCRDEQGGVRLESGGRAYLGQCAVCHGVAGEGDGPLAATIAAEGKTPPAPLRSVAAGLGRRGVLEAMESSTHRSRDSAMPIWGPYLGQKWLDRIAEFVLAMPAAGPNGRAAVTAYLADPPGAPPRGRRVYVLYCSACHGAQGGGDGFFSGAVASRLDPPPLRGEALAALGEAELSRVVGLGGAHAPKAATMPGWLYTLSPDDRQALSGYLPHIPGTPVSD